MNCRCAYEPIDPTLYSEVLAMNNPLGPMDEEFHPGAHASIALHPTLMKNLQGERIFTNNDGLFFVCRQGQMVLANMNTITQRYEKPMPELRSGAFLMTPARPLKEVTLEEVLEMKEDLEESGFFEPWISQGTISVRGTPLCNSKGEKIFKDDKGHMYVRRGNFFYMNDDALSDPPPSGPRMRNADFKVPPLPGPDQPMILTTWHNERYVPFSKRTEAEKRGVIGADPAVPGADRTEKTMVVMDEMVSVPEQAWKDYQIKLANTVPGEFRKEMMGTRIVEPLPLPVVHSDFSFTAQAFAKEKMNTKEWLEIDEKFLAMMRERMRKTWENLLPPQPPAPGTTPAQLVAVLVEREAPEGFMPSMLKEGEAMERRLHNGKAKWFIVPSLKQDDDCPAPTIIGG